MPQPISMAIRQSIVNACKKGQSISSLSRIHKVSRQSIYDLLRRYKAEGEAGLVCNYDNCGKLRPDASSFVYRAVRCMRTWHPTWGAQKIHAEMLYMRPSLELPHYRSFNRWFHWNGQLSIKPKSILPSSIHKWSKYLHEIWQVDAKEEMTTADGQKQCWLNITDEFSGAIIDPPVFFPQEDLRSSS